MPSTESAGSIGGTAGRGLRAPPLEEVARDYLDAFAETFGVEVEMGKQVTGGR